MRNTQMRTLDSNPDRGITPEELHVVMRRAHVERAQAMREFVLDPALVARRQAGAAPRRPRRSALPPAAEPGIRSRPPRHAHGGTMSSNTRTLSLQSQRPDAHGLAQKSWSWWEAYWTRRAKRTTVTLLRGLDDRTLHDIGIDRSEIESVVYGKRRRAPGRCWSA